MTSKKIKSKVALLDWDGTIRKGFTLPNWVEFLVDHGVFTNTIIDDIKRLFGQFYKGKISHDQLSSRTSKVYSRYLEGHRKESIMGFAYKFVNEDQKYLYPFSYTLFSIFREKLIQPIVISGAPIEVLFHYANKFYIKELYGLELEVENGLYTCNIKQNHGVAKAKEFIVNRIIKDSDCEIVLSIGNSSSDKPLFNAAYVSIIVDNPTLQTKGKSFHISSENTEILELLEFLEKEVANG